MMLISLMTTAVYSMRNKINARTMRRLADGERSGHAKGLHPTQIEHALETSARLHSSNRRRLRHGAGFGHSPIGAAGGYSPIPVGASVAFQSPVQIAYLPGTEPVAALRPEEEEITWQKPKEDCRKIWEKMRMFRGHPEQFLKLCQTICEKADMMDEFFKKVAEESENYKQVAEESEDTEDQDYIEFMAGCFREAVLEHKEDVSKTIIARRRRLAPTKVEMVQSLIQNTKTTMLSIFRRKVKAAVEKRRNTLVDDIKTLPEDDEPAPKPIGSDDTMSLKESLAFIRVAKSELQEIIDEKFKNIVTSVDKFNWDTVKIEEGESLEAYKELKTQVDFNEVKGFPTDAKILKEIVKNVRRAATIANDAFSKIDEKVPNIPTIAMAQQKKYYEHRFFGLFEECDRLYNHSEESWKKAMTNLHAEIKEKIDVNVKKSVPGVKGKVRAMQKFLYKYGKTARKLTDLLRASFLFDSIADIKAAVKIIENHSEFEKTTQENVPDLDEYKREQKYERIIKLKDRFTKRPKNGNSDVLINVIWQGVVVEIQLHHRKLYELKMNELHDAYEQRRYLGPEIDKLIFPEEKKDAAV